MTGAYLRIKRNDKWENIEVEYLTNEERETVFLNKDPDTIMKWLHMLSHHIQTSEKLFNELVEEGILKRQ
jgi:transcription initiation factor TFIIIB Brf1 subunit/transcription initiation factor TFIIB